MDEAIQAARRAVAAGETPFGAAMLAGDTLVTAGNTVSGSADCTAHAEINLLREAGRRLGRWHHEAAIVATTAEPCPMCAAALVFARVGVVAIGATIQDVRAAGFTELQFPAEETFARASRPPRVVAGIRRDACAELLAGCGRRESWPPTG